MSRRPDRSHRRFTVRRRADRPPVTGRFPRPGFGGSSTRRLGGWAGGRMGAWAGGRVGGSFGGRAGRAGRWIGQHAGGWAGRFSARPPVQWRSPVRGRGSRGAWIRGGARRFPGSTGGLLVWLVAGLLAFGGGTWAAARSSLLDVDRIEVVGAVQVTSVQAAEAAGVRRGEPLVDIDERRASTRLEALPWVRSARVERGFPNVVRIHVEERLAIVSAARETGGYGLLDATGRVLAEGPQRPDGLPEVVGAGSAPAPGAWMPAAKPVLDVVQALAEPLRRQVIQGSVADGSVTLRLGGTPGIEVRFGPPDSLEAKADSLAALLAHLGARPVAYVDVRVPGAPVVGPAGAAGPAPAAPNRPAAARPAAPTKPVKPRD